MIFTNSEKLIKHMEDHGYAKSYILLLKNYSIVSRLADKIQAKTEEGFNEIVLEVWNEED